MNVQMALAMLPGLVIGLSLHEFAHAWTASLLGDDFARRQGRVSLNPLRHLSPLGTLALLVLPFGWGRPVPVNLYNFRHPRRDYLLTSLAGPLANALVVGICLGLMQLTRHCFRYQDWRTLALVMAHYLLLITALLNVMLATINLIPIPPLDGSKIWPYVLPWVKPAGRPKTTWISLVVLIALLSTGSFRPVISFTVHYVMRLMPPSDFEHFSQRAEAADQALAAKRWSQAETFYTEALALNPRAHQCLYGRAVARYRQNQLPAALEDIDRALALHDCPDYRQVRALILHQLNPEEKAAHDETDGQASPGAQD